MEKTIKIEPNRAYKRIYRIRRVAPNIASIEVTVPLEVVERYASQEGVTIQQFLNDYKIEWLFDNFEGVFMRFIKDGKAKTKV